MTTESELGSGTQTFEDIVESNMIYVDKTMFLSKMIGTPTKTWFLARPRRFGKSLTVSTFKSIFLRKNDDLFKELAIFDRLTDKKFAPRPVIHLDMSSISTYRGFEQFDDSLKA
ncbi:MAG: AAA family ATPase, partial [Deltaproteobacteria bacterium]|nr:AAA family ATPase [Deltaproteobacteria bacterium]